MRYMLTLLPFGESIMSGGKRSTPAPARSAGVVGTARRKGGSGNRGRPVTGEGSVLNVAEGNGHDGSRTGSYVVVTDPQAQALAHYLVAEGPRPHRNRCRLG